MKFYAKEIIAQNYSIVTVLSKIQRDFILFKTAPYVRTLCPVATCKRMRLDWGLVLELYTGFISFTKLVLTTYA